MPPMAESKLAKVRTRLSQIGLLFSTTRAQDPRFLPWLIGAALTVALALFGVFALLGMLWSGAALGLTGGLLAAMIVFGRRSQRAALQSIAGRPGAAAAVLQQMRGSWKVEPGVAATRKQDLVHRVVGRPGVVLVGEGSPSRTSQLLKQEKRKAQRVVGDVPVHEVNVGQGNNQLPLDKLQNHLMKLPRHIKRRQIGDVDRRLQAVGTSEQGMPKGPLPKGAKVPKQFRR